MATLLDAPKSPDPAKVEEFVEKQLDAARRRVRVLDFFLVGLSLAVVSLAFLLAALLVNRYVEMPRGTWWAVLGGYVALVAGLLYVTLFRSDRRQINPYFAARQVEQTVPNAKNSLVTWVDFDEDASLPGSIRTAIGQKAARDLKTVDLNRAIENGRIVWLAVAAAVFLVANVVMVVLPPTRTELTLDEPRNGDTTVFSNQDVPFAVRVHGRVPDANDPDAVRVRMWYNPDDPESYEDRPMKPAEDDRRKFELTVPAKQTRTGFRYQVLAGNTRTSEYTVTVKIIPEFTGFDVSYEYPAYLKRDPETSNDPNLLAPYATTATIVATTNREVKHGHIEIEGQARTIDGRPVEGRPDAIQFSLKLEKEGFFRIWFTTPEGDKNQDPARLRLGVIDPKPVVRAFDLAYDYPTYLRFKPMTAADVREPDIEAPRGTKVAMTAKTTRGVKDARLEIAGHPPIAGELVADQPTWVRFQLPPIDKDSTAQVTFTPTTGENPSPARSIPIRALIDEAPRVQIDEPIEDTKEIPANGTLELKGLATDDHGVDKLTLRMKLIGAEDRDLAPRPYRGGMSFLRKEDNSWPTRVEYKDFVKLPDVRLPGNPNWRIGAGAEVEYWLEAIDNCAIPPGPNPGLSKPKRFKVLAPVVEPKEKQKLDQRNRQTEQKQQQHEKRQDKQNATEKRDVQQPPPKGADQGDKRDNPPQPGAQGEPDPTGKTGDMNPMGMGGTPPDTPPDGTPNHDQRTDQVQKALNQAQQDTQPGGARDSGQPPEGAKVDPNEGARRDPGRGPDAPPPGEKRDMKTDPAMDPMGGGAPGAPREGKIDPTKDDKGEIKDEGDNPPGMEPEAKGTDKRTYGGSDAGAGTDKPDRKEPTPAAGTPPKGQPDKGEARGNPPPKKGNAADPSVGEPTTPGTTKPDQDVTASGEKPPSSEPTGANGKTPPKDAGAARGKESPTPGGTRPEGKKDEIADKGGPRSGPKDEGAAGEDHPPPMGGAGDQQAKGATKGQQGTPPSDGGGQGELERELGELEREINSSKPKIDPNKQATADRLMRNQETREKTRQKLEELERNAENDELRKKAQDMRAAAEQAAKDYDAQRPNAENVDQLSKQLGSNNERERGDAERRIKDWEKDPQAKKDLENEVDQLKKKDPNAGQRVDDAMKKAEHARNQSGSPGETPKVDEKDLADIAKNLNGSDEKARADAKDRLEKMMRDPKTRQDAQDKLNQMADKAQTAEEKRSLQDAARQAGDMARQMAKNDGPPKGPDPKDLEKAARQLASGDAKDREQAMKDLEKMMQDPKNREQVQQMLKDMADKAKNSPEDQKALQNAAQHAQQLAKEMGSKEAPKLKPEDLKNLANQMAGQDEKAKQDAARKLNDLVNDPKTREQAKQMLEEMAKNAKNSPEDQKALDEALKQANQMAKDGPPKLKPEDLKDLAQKFKDMDPKAREELKRKAEEAMKDPKQREELRKAAEEMARNMPPEQKREFDEMLRGMGGDFTSPPVKPEQADLANKLKSAELLLEDFKKKVADDKFRHEHLKWGDEQIAGWIKDQEAAINAMRKQLENSNFRTDRNVRSPLGGGPSKVTLDEKDRKDLLRGSKYAPPSGYADPYKRFTGGSAAEPKK